MSLLLLLLLLTPIIDCDLNYLLLLDCLNVLLLYDGCMYDYEFLSVVDITTLGMMLESFIFS